jgi:hypothetical protein
MFLEQMLLEQILLEQFLSEEVLLEQMLSGEILIERMCKNYHFRANVLRTNISNAVTTNFDATNVFKINFIPA